MEQTKIPKVNLSSYKISQEVLKLVSSELMRRYNFIPLDFQNERLSVVISDFHDKATIEQIRIFSGYELDLFWASKESIEESLKRYLPSFGRPHEIKELQLDLEESALSSENQGAYSSFPGRISVKGNESGVIRVVNRLIELAVERGASDIHMEPQENALFIRFRIDGILTSIHKFPKSAQPTLVARIKVIANMNITEKRLPQDGQFSLAILKKNIDLRVSTLPGKYGEKVVIRVLDKSSFALDLSQLGFEPTMQSTFETLIQKPQGLLLVTGPTGSGKTTTLYSVLNRLKSPIKNVITLEDPIEYELLAGKSDESGITQVQVNSKIGMTFSSGLRAALRQDPDIIMVGEIRDKETAEIAMKSSLTGHLVLSTLHTNDAASTLLRLKDMEVEPYLIGSTTIGILAQRLVRVLCSHCKDPYKPPPRALKSLFPNSRDLTSDLTLYRAKGCEKCGYGGYHGRRGIFELLIMNDELKQCIHSRNSSEDDNRIMRSAVTRTLRESGLDLVKQGITAIEEIYRITMD